MPLGTLDRTPPPFFRQGPSALTKLSAFSALALFLMFADTRLELIKPVRGMVASALYPVQWLLMQPLLWARAGTQAFESVQASQAREQAAYRKLELQSQRASQVEHLTLENSRLRQLLGLREKLSTPWHTAQVLYDSADPYTHKVVIDRGSVDGVLAGSAVIDEHGVLGQVTRVYPLLSEVTLVTDREQAIPVLNTRTGLRAVAFGDPNLRASALELRYMAANADVQVGDLLTTSGVDGVYPAGLPVARVEKIERRVDSAFARISCQPVALVGGVNHVLVLEPVATQIAAPAPTEVPVVPARKGKRK